MYIEGHLATTSACRDRVHIVGADSPSDRVLSEGQAIMPEGHHGAAGLLGKDAADGAVATLREIVPGLPCVPM